MIKISYCGKCRVILAVDALLAKHYGPADGELHEGTNLDVEGEDNILGRIPLQLKDGTKIKSVGDWNDYLTKYIP